MRTPPVNPPDDFDAFLASCHVSTIAVQPDVGLDGDLNGDHLVLVEDGSGPENSLLIGKFPREDMARFFAASFVGCAYVRADREKARALERCQNPIVDRALRGLRLANAAAGFRRPAAGGAR